MLSIIQIILHLSATFTGFDLAGINLTGFDLAGNDIRSYHRNPINLGGREWKHPGYNYGVRLNGCIVQLLSEHLVANGVRGRNDESMHVCYVRNLDRSEKYYPCARATATCGTLYTTRGFTHAISGGRTTRSQRDYHGLNLIVTDYHIVTTQVSRKILFFVKYSTISHKNEAI